MIILFYLIKLINLINKKIKTACRDSGLNQGPQDLQSYALPTELSRLLIKLLQKQDI